MTPAHKIVNGKRVDLTPTEIAVIEAEWLANTPPPPRRQRTSAAVLADIQALSAADRAKLLAAVCAEFLRDHPRFAEQLGIAISGDELA